MLSMEDPKLKYRKKLEHQKESLLQDIAIEEKRLKNLEAQRNVVLEKLDALKQQLADLEVQATISTSFSPSPIATKSLTSENKITLFRHLFKGRDDVFPRLWINKNTNRKGYSPACSNEWVPLLCKKPKVKCTECPNQSFLPITDQVVRDHLQGRHVIGVYPLLKDETCWFLAVDFDKESWIDDVSAFVDTCSEKDIPVAVEKSRSGNGAHVWFFFTEPIPAPVARRLGCYLITATMERRHQLSMASYDRLFPNQDTMPKGGLR